MVFVDLDADLKARLAVRSARAFTLDGDPRTYLRVEVPSREGLEGARLLAVGDTGDRALPLDDAGRIRCGTDATCFELVLGPDVLPPDADRIALLVPDLDHRSEGPLVREALGAYAVDAEPIEENARLRIILERDPLADRLAGGPLGPDGRGFARRFEVAWAPGACGPELGSRWREARGGLPVEVEATFDPEGLACVALRPARPPEGPVVANRTVRARAVIRSFRHLYTPPEISAPLAWLTLFDLEIPSPSRCRQTQDALQDTVRAVARDIAQADGRNAPVVELDPVQIAEVAGEPCRQASDRAFSATTVAAGVRSELEAALPSRPPVRLLLLYVANLALRAPASVQVSLNGLEEALRDEGVEATFLAAIGPEVALAGLGAERSLPWLSILDPSFEDAVFELLAQAWPFTSVSHTANTIVPLADPETARGLEAFRVCEMSGRIVPVGTRVGPSAVYRPGPDGPAYRVTLDPVVLVPWSDFRAPTVEVRWEGCYGLCERPGPGRVETSWLEQDSCQP